MSFTEVDLFGVYVAPAATIIVLAALAFGLPAPGRLPGFGVLRAGLASGSVRSSLSMSFLSSSLTLWLAHRSD